MESITGDDSHLAAHLVALRAAFDLPGTGIPSLEFDSARPEEAQLLFQPIRRFTGAPFELVVDHARGSVRRVSGLDAVCDQTLAEVTRLCDPKRSDQEIKHLIELFNSLLQTFRDDRLREMFGLFIDVGPLQPGERWSRARALRSALERSPARMTVEIRRAGPRHLHWRRTREEQDGFEASGDWHLDAWGRVEAATIEDVTTTARPQKISVERRWTFRMTVLP